MRKKFTRVQCNEKEQTDLRYKNNFIILTLRSIFIGRLKKSNQQQTNTNLHTLQRINKALK